MAKGEILPRDQMASAKPVVQHVRHKFIRAHQAEIVVKREFVQQIDPLGGQRIGAFR